MPRNRLSPSTYTSSQYVPQDINFDSEEDREYELEQEEKKQTRRAKNQRWRELTDPEFELKRRYLQHRTELNLSHAQAVLAVDPEQVYYKMPPKRTTTKKTGAAAKVTKKPSYTSKTKTTASRGVDTSKLVKAAVEKALAKNIESQQTNVDILMDTPAVGAVYNTRGTTMSALNQTSSGSFDNDRMLAFNLSSMIQVRGSTSIGATSGWRVGYKVNVMSIRVDIRGIVPNCSVECKYHAMICRKKDGVRAEFFQPTVIDMNDAQLWRKNDGGPFAYNSFHSDFPTLDKKNTEVWSWPQGMHVEKTVSPAPFAGATRTFGLSMYKEVGAVWEFNTAAPSAENALKDGDYVLFLFREGPDDPGAASTKIRATVVISFKDA
jgi:hypothetical protein